jgi:hypothetical protein
LANDDGDPDGSQRKNQAKLDRQARQRQRTERQATRAKRAAERAGRKGRSGADVESAGTKTASEATDPD